MSAGVNIARPTTPIDLETLRRNLREVMTNLRLLENGENVRVEDLIRQARGNLDRNRRFVLHIGQNQGNRNDNRILTNQIERIPVVCSLQRATTGEQQPLRALTGNLGNNAEEQVGRNQGDNIEQNQPGDNNDPVRHMANRVREWAERYERDWVQFRSNGQDNGTNAGQNMEINAPIERGNPNVIDIRLPGAAVNHNAGPIRINRDNNGVRARPGNYELPPHLGAIGVRPAGVPGGPHYPIVAGPIPPPPPRFAPYPRPVGLNQNSTLEERITFLQDRLDRLEDGRFYEYMIQEGGQDRVRDMIGRLRRRVQQENGPNANANLSANGTRYNFPNAETNQEGAVQLMPPPPRRDVPQLAPRTPQLAASASDQTINQQNPTVKRPRDAGTSGKINDEQGSIQKRPKIQGHLPGRGSDPGQTLPQRTGDNAVPGPSNCQRNSLDVTRSAQSAQNAPGNISTTAPRDVEENHQEAEATNKHRRKKHRKNDRSKRGKKKVRPENTPDDQRPSTSCDPTVNTDTERNGIEIRKDTDNKEDNRQNDTIYGSVVEGPAENVLTAANISDANEEDEQDPNADVIIVGAFFPVHIKVEKNDDDNNGQNNHLNQVNAAQNHAEPPVIPQNDNGDRREPPRMIRPGGAPRPREVIPHGRELRVERILNYARAVVDANARARGPDFPGALERPFITLKNMVAGLHYFVQNEITHENRRPAQLLENEREENQLQLIQTYVRLRRELREVISNSERLGMRDYNINVFNGQIILWLRIVGPPGTAYDGAEIPIRIRVTMTEYSDVRLAQRTWHPNMCPFTGIILPIYPWNNWTLFKILVCIRRLLIIPELDNTTHDVVARQYLANREIFNRTAQHWTSVYGRGGRNDNLAIPEYTELLERLVEEGVPKDRALHLLSKNNWDIDKAMEEIG